MNKLLSIASALALALAVGISAAQEQPGSDKARSSPPQVLSSYTLGPGDEVVVWVRDLEEMNNKRIKVENDGYVSLPLLGRVLVAGLTLEDLERTLKESLKPQILEPEVTVGLAEARSQPVSVIGAVNHPGVLQVQGSKTLIEVLSMAEGLRPDASNTITITRRMEYGAIPLPDAAADPSNRFSVVNINVNSGLMSGQHPQSNIAMKPFDVISVPKADLVYVIGEVQKAGGFVLNDRETLSVLQALSMAEGLTRTASPKGAKILRESEGGTRKEITVDLGKILAGKGEDIRMRANDILFVPNSATKSATLRALQSAVEIGTGIAIWRR